MFKNRPLLVTLTLFIAIFLLNQLSSCNGLPRNEAHREISESSIRRGKNLARKYCQSCHLLPDPSMLDFKSWEKGVLPNMGPRLGIHGFKDQQYPSSRWDANVGPTFYPARPVVSDEEWQDIINYYIATSPDTVLVKNDQPKIKMGLPLFEVQIPSMKVRNPVTSFVKINTASQPAEVVISELNQQQIYRLDRQLNKIDSIRTGGTIVNMEFSDNSLLACGIGMLNPHTGKLGSGQFFKVVDNKLTPEKERNFKDLARPVQITRVDLNSDGREDYLVCEFGFVKGALSWMENTPEGLKKHVIRELPGAARAVVTDDNRDGKPDIWVLFTQGDEGIFQFTNKGNGRFAMKAVLRFPPMYGSSYFDLVDFDKDGDSDVIYTCGDNADYSAIFKPYHGLYIYLNDGKGRFEKRFFYQINGCYKAIANDFDADGDLDVATISFFADYEKKPEEGFVYFKNGGGMKLEPYSLPEARQGRWLTMDAGDLDGDGRTDLILGNFSVGPIMRKPVYNWRKGPPFLVLRNLGK